MYSQPVVLRSKRPLLCPESTTVEPPEEAATAAEPPEVSVVSTCESLSCPVTAYELWSCPESAEEAAFELPVPSVTTEEAIGELPDCCVAPIGAIYESSC